MDQPGPLPNTHGLLRVYQGTDPAAGANIAEAVATNSRIRLLSIRFVLVTDITAVLRQVRLRFQATNIAFDIYTLITQAASLTYTYNFIAGGPDRSAVIGTTVIAPLPLNLLLNDAFSILSAVDNLQAGDNIGAPLLFVEEWIEE